MASSTLARLERILVLVPWLLDHPGVELDEISERFGIPPGEVLRDLDVLGYTGLPGYGGGDLVEVSVADGRVSVRLADFFARPLTLTLREAVTLLLAASTVAAVPGGPESPALRRAIAKLEGALGAQPRIAVALTAPGDELLGLLRDAIAQHRVVHLRYLAASTRQMSERDVEPLALVGARGVWYLQAWCRRAQGLRHFRLDRIAEAQVLDEHFAARRREPRPPTYRPEPSDVRVVLDLRPGARWVADEVVAEDVEQRGDIRRVVLRTRALEWLARLVLAASPDADVVEPAALAQRVRALAAETLARYR